MSNVQKATDKINELLGKGEKWFKATTPEQNALIGWTALSDAGIGAAVGAVGGLFTDQGMVNGAMSGAMLGAGAGALMKRSQILESGGSKTQENINRMTAQRSRALKKADVTDVEAIRYNDRADIVKHENRGKVGPSFDEKDEIARLKGKAAQAERISSSLRARGAKLTKSIDAEQAVLSSVNSTAATGAGAVGGLASLAFATLDSNRV